jgi:RimJ/RimL family protein N-acetyltransferase
MGYMIHHTHWGLGLASRAVKVFLAYYWNVLNPHREHKGEDDRSDVVEAHIDPANAASEHIAQKLGFEPGQWASEEFRLAHSQELRRLRVWRVRRPLTAEASEP